MTYQLYRCSTLGITLRETLDDLLQAGEVTADLALKVMQQFDKSINTVIGQETKTRIKFKAGRLETYQFCDDVWTFVLSDVDFHMGKQVVNVDRIKIVACDGKPSKDT
ncbi:transcription initiation factor IIA subunit 2-like [Scaptodrosophila lebanonensis]|uniref:Transcription initiation factor IIA subunit 2 n=1 Tax=Drosophila lebanonensis TaxID=7225 RepID=A0A6J2U125_DROLE|nr:transcription initiation factor IIA subunit 2-like [Scaptodrosophila lebanonensis]